MSQCTLENGSSFFGLEIAVVHHELVRTTKCCSGKDPKLSMFTNSSGPVAANNCNFCLHLVCELSWAHLEIT